MATQLKLAPACRTARHALRVSLNLLTLGPAGASSAKLAGTLQSLSAPAAMRARLVNFRTRKDSRAARSATGDTNQFSTGPCAKHAQRASLNPTLVVLRARCVPPARISRRRGRASASHARPGTIKAMPARRRADRAAAAGSATTERKPRALPERSRRTARSTHVPVAPPGSSLAPQKPSRARSALPGNSRCCAQRNARHARVANTRALPVKVGVSYGHLAVRASASTKAHRS